MPPTNQHVVWLRDSLGQLERRSFTNSFPRKPTKKDEEVKIVDIWQSESDGTFRCSLCKAKKSKSSQFDPATEYFNSKMQHNTYRTHTIKLMQLLHVEEGLTIVH